MTDKSSQSTSYGYKGPVPDAPAVNLAPLPNPLRLGPPFPPREPLDDPREVDATTPDTPQPDGQPSY